MWQFRVVDLKDKTAGSKVRPQERRELAFLIVRLKIDSDVTCRVPFVEKSTEHKTFMNRRMERFQPSVITQGDS